ncbi:MAG: hypothetical protein WCE88_12415, partial [Burkholderiales bacterium]
ITLWLSRGSDIKITLQVILFTGTGVAIGCLALAALRPQKAGLSPPHVMLSLGVGGMLLGLGVDVFNTPIEVINSFCVSSSRLSIKDSLVFHGKLLPAMHIFMLVGGISAIPSLKLLSPQCKRLCSMLTQNMLCSTWMLFGMTLGAIVFVERLNSAGDMSLNKMLGGMFTGMVWGMVISVSLYRAFFVIKDKIHEHKLLAKTGGA